MLGPLMPTDAIPIEKLSFAAYRLQSGDVRQAPSAFISLAHWFEAEKFRAFHRELFDEVMLCPTVRDAKKFATKNKANWRGDWLGLRLRALACGMHYAYLADPTPERWKGTPESIASMLAPFEFPEKFVLGASMAFVGLRDAGTVSILGASTAPSDVVGKRINQVHKRADRLWKLLHWQGRHGCWKVHDWALSQYVPIQYAGADDARLNDEAITMLRNRAQNIVVFEARGGKRMDATIRALRLAKAPMELDLYRVEGDSALD